jgi:hypothetical protein
MQLNTSHVSTRASKRVPISNYLMHALRAQDLAYGVIVQGAGERPAPCAQLEVLDARQLEGDLSPRESYHRPSSWPERG